MDFNSLPGKMTIGALGGMGAACCCHPLDVIRVTMQVATKQQSTLATAMSIFQEGGLRQGLYSGLSAAFLRQWTYGAGRIGIYSFLLSREQNPSFGKKLGFGVVSGGVGSLIGTPAELALVRMSADARLPLAERRAQGVHRVLAAVVRDEGVMGMWRGVSPTIVRAMALSSTSLAVTSESKVRLPKLLPALNDWPTLNFLLATVVGSFVGTVASQPFDVVKSRIQNQSTASPLYSSTLDCASQTLREGPLTFFRGFTPSFLKFAPYTMISLTLVEKLTVLLTGKGAL